MENNKGSGGKSGNNSPYKGIRMRKWGKWVTEIRQPSKQTRIWLGSYSIPIAGACAYDTAEYYFWGPNAKLNFPDEIFVVDLMAEDLRPENIQWMAAKVGARVDALQVGAKSSFAVVEKINLNRNPKPEENSNNGVVVKEE